MLEREQALLFLPIDEDLRFWLNRIPIDIFTETLLTLQNHIIQYTNTKKNKSHISFECSIRAMIPRLGKNFQKQTSKL